MLNFIGVSITKLSRIRSTCRPVSGFRVNCFDGACAPELKLSDGGMVFSTDGAFLFVRAKEPRT